MSITVKNNKMDTGHHRPPQNCELATNFMHICLQYV